MKGKTDNVEETYDKCCANGLIVPREEPNNEKSVSLLSSAKQGLDRMKIAGMEYEKQTHNFSFLLRDHYEVLRMLIDAFLSFDGVSIGNHQCSNAYLCVKHPELELSWEMLESARILRNSVNYQGKIITQEQWKQLKLPFEIYISTLQKAIEGKLK